MFAERTHAPFHRQPTSHTHGCTHTHAYLAAAQRNHSLPLSAQWAAPPKQLEALKNLLKDISTVLAKGEWVTFTFLIHILLGRAATQTLKLLIVAHLSKHERSFLGVDLIGCHVGWSIQRSLQIFCRSIRPSISLHSSKAGSPEPELTLADVG